MSGALALLLSGSPVASGGTALTATANDMTPSGVTVDPGTASTNACTITPAGGTSPYRYAWT